MHHTTVLRYLLREVYILHTWLYCTLQLLLLEYKHTFTNFKNYDFVMLRLSHSC
jgi:hypothetical protein